MADAATSNVTVDDLTLPDETIGHISSVIQLEADDVTIVYAVKDGDGKAELVKRGGAYRVTFAHYPWEPDAVDMFEVEWFDNLSKAVRQLAEWMMLEPDAFLDIEDDVDG